MKKTLSKRIYVSMDEMERAYNKVRKELEKVGLLYDDTPMDEVECYHERLSPGGLSSFVGVMGFYDFDDCNIHIPAMYPAGLFPWYADREILDVIRHEFGHALADRYPKYFDGRIFKAAFGDVYGENQVFEGDDWSEEYVTEYASEMTQEDFAETFMLYMKYKGKLPAKFRGKKAIEKKWNVVETIVSKIAAQIIS